MHDLLRAFIAELNADLPDATLFARVTVRLLLATLLSAIIGWEREREHKAAGLRTHILVALGAAIFVLSALESSAAPDAVTRVVQGVSTGIGFIGGGVILQLVAERRVKGLTTAAGLWLTAAIGLASGMGHVTTAILGTVLCWTVLGVLHRLERDEKDLPPTQPNNGQDASDATT